MAHSSVDEQAMLQEELLQRITMDKTARRAISTGSFPMRAMENLVSPFPDEIKRISIAFGTRAVGQDIRLASRLLYNVLPGDYM